MTYRISDFYAVLDELAPFSSSQSWDNAGLLVGSPETEVSGVVVALDLTSDVLSEAAASGANLIITHHPVIFPAVRQIPISSLLYKLIENKISVISAHTNLDASLVNAELCKRLGLDGVLPLESQSNPGIGRIGRLSKPLKSCELAELVKSSLDACAVRYTQGKLIKDVAVCGGSGSELLHDAVLQGAQALVTSEVKHHIFLEAMEAGFTIVDAGHYATEAVVVAPLAELLRAGLPGSAVTVSTAMRDPVCCLPSP